MSGIARWLGLRETWAVARRELYSYVVSPMPYVVAAVFLVITGVIFYSMMANPIAGATLRPLLPSMVFLLGLVVPIFTMRLIAEEKAAGTIELLMTFPLTDGHVVMGKYLATFVVYVVMLVPTVTFPLVLWVYGARDIGPLGTAYIGLVLLGAAFLAVGIFASSLARSQIIAAVVGVGLLLLLWVIGFVAQGLTPVVGATLARGLGYLSLVDHFEDFGRGMIETRDVVYYLTFTCALLFLTVQAVQSSRWRG